MDINSGAIDAAYMVTAGDYGLLPAGDGDVHGRGGHMDTAMVYSMVDHDGEAHDAHADGTMRPKGSPGMTTDNNGIETIRQWSLVAAIDDLPLWRTVGLVMEKT